MEAVELAERPVLGQLVDALAALEKARSEGLWQLSEGELGQALGLLDGVRTGVESLTVAVVAEAQQRAMPSTVGDAATAEWVATHAASLSHHDAFQVAFVARGCQESRNEAVATAMADGRLTIRRAGRVLRYLEQIAPLVGAGELDEVSRILVEVADWGTDRELAAAIRASQACVMPDGALEREEGRWRSARSLRRLAECAGMARYELWLDPAGAAELDAAIGPLSRPVPDASGPDRRSPQARRADALIEIVRRGVAAPEGMPQTTKTQLVVMIGWEQLSGAARGVGVTLGAEALSPGAVRRMACDAGVIPMVLGAEGEILDVGRRRRLVTPGQLRTLWVRDRGCTFPGCSVPAAWADAHHVRHWADGGATDLGNLALLCGRHHSIVHQRALSADVDASGVTWHL